MDINFKLEKSAIMPEVYRITGYTGDKNSDMDKISSTEDDVALLSSYFEEAMSMLQDVIMRFGTVSWADGDAEIDLVMPSNWKDNTAAMKRSCRQLAVNYICMMWFNVSKKEEVKSYEETCERLTSAINKYLFERTRPTRS